MNPRTLIRSAAATLAATTFLFAQSAPLPTEQAKSAPKASTISPERLQVRLAEVIAMLEEDDLTAEQRDAAKKKLQEISVRLKAAQANDAWQPGARSRTGMLATPAPTAAVEPAAPVDPATPPVARAPRAPRPPAVPDIAVVQDPAPRAIARVGKPVEVEEVRSAAEKLHAEARVLHARAMAEHAKAATEAETVEGFKAKAKDVFRAAQKARAQAEAAEQDAVRVRRLRTAEGEAVEVAEMPKTAKSPMVLQRMDGASAEAKPVKGAKPKVLSLDDVTEVRSGRALGGLMVPRKAPKPADADDDDEVMELLQQMRAEMKEIKKMLQDLKRQQTRTTRTRIGMPAMPGMPAMNEMPGASGGGHAFGRGRSEGGQARTFTLFGQSDDEAKKAGRGAFGGGQSGGGGKARTFTLFEAADEAKPKSVTGTFSPNGDFKVFEAEGGNVFTVERPAQGQVLYEFRSRRGEAGEEKAVEVVAPKASGKRIAVRTGGGDDEMK